jgi:Tol biopolymer transport system component
MGGAWSADGVIIFAIWPLGPAPLYQVSDAGGEPRQVLTVEGFSDRGQRRSPAFLPDGRHFLYLGISDAQTDLTGIYLSSLDNSEAQLLVRADSFAAYALDKTHDKGYLVFVREGTLQAQPFDLSHLTTIGDAVSLTERVGVDQNLRSKLSVSDNGVLVYGTGSGSELHWFDRKGSSLGALGPQGSHIDFRISPDGLRVADQRDTETGRADIYLLDLERGTSERITFQQTYYAAPVWTPNSSNLTFFSTREGRWSIWEKATNGMGVERQLLRSENDLVPNDWSADGRILLYTEITLETGWDLWFLTREGDPANEPRLTPFISTPANENFARFSPDGKWVVYSSNQSGRYEIYVRPFPADDTRSVGKLISTHGGSEPRWPRGGEEIFYIDPNDMLMAVKVTTGETVEAGVPNALFLTRPVGAVLRYDVTSDGERFLVATPTDDTVSAPVTVVLNWFAELDRRSL